MREGKMEVIALLRKLIFPLLQLKQNTGRANTKSVAIVFILNDEDFYYAGHLVDEKTANKVEINTMKGLKIKNNNYVQE